MYPMVTNLCFSTIFCCIYVVTGHFTLSSSTSFFSWDSFCTMCLLCESSRDSISRLTSSTLHSISTLQLTFNETKSWWWCYLWVQRAQKSLPEHLHLSAQLRYTVMLCLVNGEQRVAATIRTLPAAKATFWQVSLQAPPLDLHGTAWEGKVTRVQRPRMEPPRYQCIRQASKASPQRWNLFAGTNFSIKIICVYKEEIIY